MKIESIITLILKLILKPNSVFYIQSYITLQIVIFENVFLYLKLYFRCLRVSMI